VAHASGEFVAKNSYETLPKGRNSLIYKKEESPNRVESSNSVAANLETQLSKSG